MNSLIVISLVFLATYGANAEVNDVGGLSEEEKALNKCWDEAAIQRNKCEQSCREAWNNFLPWTWLHFYHCWDDCKKALFEDQLACLEQAAERATRTQVSEIQQSDEPS